MGFWAGFADEYSNIIDRRQKMEMLMKELGAKRKESLLRVAQAKTKRDDSAYTERQALELINQRIGNDVDPDVKEEFMTNLAKTRQAGPLLEKFSEFEARNVNNNIKFVGEALINNVNLTIDPETNRPTMSLNEILEMDLSDDDNFRTATEAVNNIETGGGATDLVLTDNLTVKQSDLDNVRKNLHTRVAEIVSPIAVDNAGGPINSRLWQLMETANDSSNTIAANNARTQLLKTPYGFQAYVEMIESDDTVNKGLKQIPEYAELQNAYENYTNYDRFDENSQQEFQQSYPYAYEYWQANQGE